MATIVKNKKNRLIDKVFNRAKIYELNEIIDEPTEKKIGVNVQSNLNIIQLSENDVKAKQTYLKLINLDYMFYLHYKGVSYFIKRKELKEIWERKDLYVIKDTFYTINKPINEQLNDMLPANLVVIFSSYPVEKSFASGRIANRIFEPYYTNIQNSLIENTYVVRILDNNQTYGSYYMNTSNFPDFEENIQKIISEVIEEFKIDANNVVCLGEGKGGTAAYYHAKLGGFSAVSVSPILSTHEKNEYEKKVKLPFSIDVDIDQKIESIEDKGNKGVFYVIQPDYLDGSNRIKEQKSINYPTEKESKVYFFGEQTQAIQSMLINEILFMEFRSKE
ncbi:hypothetical protein IGI37_001173 [Enterococcus sp. AZ194]|uniref:XcbB/CpsF family capsular polysaccharide biosynthesis protein n=1 Tax=Enterococcus sp. AZ194 TaxID=2774629 RepID=UPI003F28108B